MRISGFLSRVSLLCQMMLMAWLWAHIFILMIMFMYTVLPSVFWEVGQQKVSQNWNVQSWNTKYMCCGQTGQCVLVVSKISIPLPTKRHQEREKTWMHCSVRVKNRSKKVDQIECKTGKSQEEGNADTGRWFLRWPVKGMKNRNTGWLLYKELG